jgi:hypothetical protein
MSWLVREYGRLPNGCLGQLVSYVWIALGAPDQSDHPRGLLETRFSKTGSKAAAVAGFIEPRFRWGELSLMMLRGDWTG